MRERWRAAFASVMGTSHEKDSMPCQDACGCRIIEQPDGNSILLAIACDGAGTAPRSQEGAQLTVGLFLDIAEAACHGNGMTAIDRGFVDHWLEQVKEEIRRRATDELCAIRDFACTAIGAIIGESDAVFFQIGDGGIVVAEHDSPDAYAPVFMPQHGEFANTTNFVIQDNTPEVLAYRRSPVRYDEIAVFTDGIERLVLNIAEQTAHSPFFRPLFAWLATTAPEDRAGSSAIRKYLASETICKRTDDDKTLVLATRRSSVSRPG